MSGKSRNFAVRLRDASISDETDTSFSTRSARDLTANLLSLGNVQTSLTLLSLTRRLVACLRCKASLTRLENHSLLALLENTWRVCSRSRDLKQVWFSPRLPADLLRENISRVCSRSRDLKQAWFSPRLPADLSRERTHPRPAHRREWGLAPLCGAVVTFSHYSKDPSRP